MIIVLHIYSNALGEKEIIVSFTNSFLTALNNSTILIFSLEFNRIRWDLPIFYWQSLFSLLTQYFIIIVDSWRRKQNTVSLTNIFLSTNIIHHSNLFTELQWIISVHLWELCLIIISVEMTTPRLSLDFLEWSGCT